MKYMNQTAYGKHCGVSQQTVSKWAKRGFLDGATKKFGGKTLINPDIADVLILEYLPDGPGGSLKGKAPRGPMAGLPDVRAGGAGVPVGPVAPVVPVGQMTADQAKTAQARHRAALMELELEEKKGKLVSAEKVEADFFNLARLTRDAVLNVPDRIGAELASITDPHVLCGKLTEELVAALDDLSRKKI